MLVHVLRPTLVGLIIGSATVIISLLIISAIATAYDIPSAAVVPLVTVINAIGAFCGGYASAKTNKRNGWLLGLLAALMLFLFSTAAGFGFFNKIDGGYLSIKAAIMLACGMVGGIFAVNSGRRHKR